MGKKGWISVLISQFNYPVSQFFIFSFSGFSIFHLFIYFLICQVSSYNFNLIWDLESDSYWGHWKSNWIDNWLKVGRISILQFFSFQFLIFQFSVFRLFNFFISIFQICNCQFFQFPSFNFGFLVCWFRFHILILRTRYGNSFASFNEVYCRFNFVHSPYFGKDYIQNIGISHWSKHLMKFLTSCSMY